MYLHNEHKRSWTDEPTDVHAAYVVRYSGV